MLGALWWMYGGYVWMTNAVATDKVGRRLLLLGGMGAYLILDARRCRTRSTTPAWRSASLYAGVVLGPLRDAQVVGIRT